MAVLPGEWTLLIPQRADLELLVTLPIDCTGKTAAAQVWNDRRSKLLLELDVEWLDRVAGELKLSAPWSRTKLVTTTGQWDLLLVDDATDERDFWLHGPTSFDPGFTELPEVLP